MMLFRIPKSWLFDAPCRQLGDEQKRWFYTQDDNGYEKAKAICRRCPAKGECLEIAMDLESRGLGVGPHGERFGVWGGKTGNQRARMARGIA